MLGAGRCPLRNVHTSAAVFDLLTDKGAQGSYTKCHSVDDIQGKCHPYASHSLLLYFTSGFRRSRTASPYCSPPVSTRMADR